MVDPAGLARCWAHLDELLLAAIGAAERRAADPFRGLHLTAADVTAAFDRPAGEPRLAGPRDGPPGWADQLAWLVDGFGLDPFDLDVVLICLAPEVDLRYERAYAFLQDDVRRRRPSIDLVLELLCDTAGHRIAQRSRFAPDAPLVRHGMVHIDPPDDGGANAPLLAHTLRLDAQIVDVLLGQAGIDRRLAGWCRLVEPGPADDPRTDSATVTALSALVADARHGSEPLRVYLQGPPSSPRVATAAAVAAAVGVPLLCVEVGELEPARQRELLPIAVREARLQDALLMLNGADGLVDEPDLLRVVARDRGVTVLAGTRPWPAVGDVVAGTVTVLLTPPGVARRRACWESELRHHGVELATADLDVLAARFRLDVAQIEDAAAAARPTAALRDPGAEVALIDVQAAVRDRSGHELTALARRVRPHTGWDDLVLPPDVIAQLREVCDRARHRERVLVTWGFGRRGGRGQGTSVLFTGASGTGKTSAAEIIANELGLDLYTIDLGRVVSKYIGETEKNLGRIFDAARDANAVLLFDEADALFGKRSEVRDSHDRYANIEVSFLLQRIEQFDGVAILATNLRQHLDEALLRRLAFSISFPFPDEESRRRIWDVVWPDVPRADGIDVELLARRFALSGGNIRNIALAASFLAAADGGVVTMDHLLHATRREYQKLGKALAPAELAVPAAMVEP